MVRGIRVLAAYVAGIAAALALTAACDRAQAAQFRIV